MKLKLTATALKGLKPAPQRYTAWDMEDKGLGFEVLPSGACSWYYKYSRFGVPTRLFLAHYPAMTLKQAKTQVRYLKGLKESPAKTDPKSIQSVGRKPITIADLAKKFQKDYFPRLALNTQKKYANALKLYIVPRLGHLVVSRITEEEIRAVHASMAQTQPSANYTLEILSSMLVFGGRKDNPCSGVRRYQITPRQQYLTPQDYQAIAGVLEGLEFHKDAINALRLILLTGMRKSEVTGLEFSMLDRGAMTLTLPVHKTSRKTGQKCVNLPQEAMELFQASGSGLIFRGPSGGKLWCLDNLWRLVRGRCGLEAYTIHDLRHGYASLLLSSGYSLEEIGPLLGHTSLRSTMRYAHLLQDKQKALACKAGGLIAGAMKRPR